MSIQTLPAFFAIYLLGEWSGPILRWSYIRRISPNAIHPYEWEA